MTRHIAVLMGGWCAERPVSLTSGADCAKGLEEAGYRVTRVDVDRNALEVLSSLAPDLVFNALHGPFGEDGKIQGILEYLQIPYTHSGVLASALAMNKDKAKTVMAAAGVPVAPSKIVHRLDAAREHVMRPPYVLKPISEGSSFGVLIVGEDMEYPPQQLYASDWAFGDYMLAERYVAGRELSCAVMGDVALGVVEIKTVGQDFYDYDSKYRPGGSEHVIPAKCKQNIYQNIQSLALTAHESLGCRGVSRADFRLDDRINGTGELVCLEVNTQPGMTKTSLVPEIAAHAGHDFIGLLKWMVEDASCDR
ncbi:MAG: D-alanine--D-alanine ligase [Cohaesibacteraceae bacterium]|nr:D-alanine--D-alanine ligase [Cohaesibacteraceae bacterium]MBL4875725.1 D-alanine--D-alanine ligase [Cohaesibacteraceae bacterium]